MKEIDLINNEDLRNQCIDHYEVLEKVKELLLIPGTDFMSVKQVADYYEVGESSIRMLYADKTHKKEFDSDGVCLKSYKDFLKSSKLTLEMKKGKAVFSDGDELFEVPMRGIRVFPRRAILRIGMLLRDSEIAKEVRTALLNIEEKTSDETKIADITEEQQLALSVGMAYASGNPDAIIMATGKMMDFKNRHINTLEQDNKALAGEILEWKDRSKLNAGIRKLSAVTRVPFKDLWVKLYKNLQYKYGIDLKSRNGGKKPYIANIKEEEWDKVLKSFSAMCKAYGQSPANMFQQTLSV
ncbi:hypothetical protein [Robinsoniella peoriensis]|uniref:hypothetical protein n=1 Tax=Robinsoniella peoriensis TaxID=180332 RepID=UPI000AED3C73|nr:hypothetical protein [Robinsoniella peoriensis]